MTEESQNEPEVLRVHRQCAGGCGARLSYAIEGGTQSYLPDLYCLDGQSQFRGGHLCTECEMVVSLALEARRAPRQLEKLPAAVRDLVVRQTTRRRPVRGK